MIDLITLKISSNNRNTKEIHDYMQKKYCLGTLGVIEAVAAASLTITNIKPLSIMIISPSGQMKSQVAKEICDIFRENAVMIPSRFTPYGLSKKLGKPRLNNKTWIVNDMVRTFDGMPQVKVAEIVGWLSEIISEGKSDSITAQEADLEAKMNLIGNIAIISYRETEKKFNSSTLN